MVKTLWKKLQNWDEKRWAGKGLKKWEVSRLQGKEPFIRQFVKRYVAVFFFTRLASSLIVKYAIVSPGKPLRQIIIKLILGIIFDIAFGYWLGKWVWRKNEELFVKVTNEGE